MKTSCLRSPEKGRRCVLFGGDPCLALPILEPLKQHSSTTRPPGAVFSCDTRVSCAMPAAPYSPPVSLRGDSAGYRRVPSMRYKNHLAQGHGATPARRGGLSGMLDPVVLGCSRGNDRSPEAELGTSVRPSVVCVMNAERHRRCQHREQHPGHDAPGQGGTRSAPRSENHMGGCRLPSWRNEKVTTKSPTFPFLVMCFFVCVFDRAESCLVPAAAGRHRGVILRWLFLVFETVFGGCVVYAPQAEKHHKEAGPTAVRRGAAASSGLLPS